jgi:(E)-4-hydroxy-3-methylbut-2-enyl-diphosphate synthase
MIAADKTLPYCVDLFDRKRFNTIEVEIGSLKLGGKNPIRVQSMTTIDTMDTQGSIDQAIRMIDAGSELVRLTAPSKNEAENLGHIREELIRRGYNTPLVADIHFTPNAAEIAAKLVEKVRVNPGNYADKKKFEEIAYTEESYLSELQRIESKLVPLITLCKQHNTALRIGTNHGSLSDRILSRYGDTPEGMVESAMEFIRICEKHQFYNLVISMKASNTLVMVQAYRLLAATMLQNGKCYPLHLGVTEAGDGEDGRIKSAVGIGALLEDGLGDTIRVSLTEEPEFEIPVAQKLIQKYVETTNVLHIEKPGLLIPYSPFHYSRRETVDIHNVGGKNTPVVISDLSSKKEIIPANLYAFGYNYNVQLDKWNLTDQASDYVYIGDNQIQFGVPGTLGVICSYSNWKENYSERAGYYPLINIEKLGNLEVGSIAFVSINCSEKTDLEVLKDYPNAIIVLKCNYTNKTQVFRKYYFDFAEKGIKNPVILQVESTNNDTETFQLHTSSEAGAMLIDGFGDGIWLKGAVSNKIINATAFGILQATRTRISKTEYISCPSCGRTLFDLQETTQKIREKTAHLKGIKIGIMGCIVNGPGEMADADYGYVGTGPGKINLYKEKIVVKKNVPETEAVQELIQLIKENGDWIDPTN